jgi:hypothetical protein
LDFAFVVAGIDNSTEAYRLIAILSSGDSQWLKDPPAWVLGT